MLYDWILRKRDTMLKKMNFQGKKAEVNLKLLYKATNNGDSSYNFHNYCDNKGVTLTLIRNTKGFRFGGFTTQNWSNRP